jgi:hypothetical protein
MENTLPDRNDDACNSNTYADTERLDTMNYLHQCTHIPMDKLNRLTTFELKNMLKTTHRSPRTPNVKKVATHSRVRTMFVDPPSGRVTPSGDVGNRNATIRDPASFTLPRDHIPMTKGEMTLFVGRIKHLTKQASIHMDVLNDIHQTMASYRSRLEDTIEHNNTISVAFNHVLKERANNIQHSELNPDLFDCIDVVNIKYRTFIDLINRVIIELKDKSQL